jgi:hypothetical protein
MKLWVLLLLVFVAGAAAAEAPYTWSSVGPMGTARTDACAVLLQDGRALVIGGLGADGSALASAEFFNADYIFTAAPPLNTARTNQSCSMLTDGRVLVAGGNDSQGNAIGSAEIFDPVANTWQTIANLNQPRFDQIATVLQDGRVLLAGGCSAPGVVLGTLELFDPTTNAFTTVSSPLSSPRHRFAAAVLDTGQVLLIGGSDGTQSLASTDLFDPVTGSVSPGPNLLVARAAHTANSLLDGRVLVVGGNDGNQDLASAEFYDPGVQSFSFTYGSLATPRSGHLALVIPNNNNVLIVDGMSNGVALAACELYNLGQDTFTSAGSTGTPRAHAAGTAFGPGMIFTAGGQNDTGVEARAGVNLGVSIGWQVLLVPSNVTIYQVGLKGSGFLAGETVNFQLQIQNNSGIQLQTLASGTADSSGNFNVTDGLTVAPGTWTITAVGQISGFQARFKRAVIIPALTPSFSCNPCSLGQSVTITVVAKNANPTLYAGSVGTGGTIDFRYIPAGQTGLTSHLGTVSVIVNSDGSGTGIFTSTWNQADEYDIFANFTPGGTDGFISTPTFTNLTINKAATTTTIASSLNPVAAGAQVTLTASFPYTSGPPLPTGMVTFFDGAIQLQSGILTGYFGNIASAYYTGVFTAGTHSITAKYAGDSNYIGSTSPAVTLTAKPGITPTVSLTASPNPSFRSEFITLRAVMPFSFTGPPPTGIINFRDTPCSVCGPNFIAEAPVILNLTTNPPTATATFTTSILSSGTHNLTAQYGGDANYSSATSPVFVQTVH